MRVAEIDWEQSTWRVPAERMKMEEDHVVPLSGRAKEILSNLVTKEASPDDYVFGGSSTTESLGLNALLNTLKVVAEGMTTHGCRSTFRDWAGDCTDFPREIAEAALAHAVGNEVERAYRRGRALEKRRLLMEEWERYLQTK
jgi:integrase